MNNKQSEFLELLQADSSTYLDVTSGTPSKNRKINIDNIIKRDLISPSNYTVPSTELLTSILLDIDSLYIHKDGSNSEIENIQFKTDDNYTPTNTGELGWNNITKTLDLKLIGDCTIQLGQETVFYARAQENIANGDIIQYVTALGNNIIIKKAVPTEVNLKPSLLLGVATENITANANGYVTILGEVRGISTLGYADGTILYYNSTPGSTPGTFTAIKPIATYAQIVIGVVSKASSGAASNGILYVRQITRSKLEELEGVNITSKETGDLLQYDSNGNVINTKIISGDIIFTNNLTAAGFKSGTKDNTKVLLNGGLDTPLSEFEKNTNKGQANGYCPLGSDAKVPTTFLPAYVDDVIEGYYRVSNSLFYTTVAYTTLIPGEVGKIYVSLDTNKTYRWTGSVFIYITSGAVDSVNGKTGVVVLNPTDVGAAAAVHTHGQYIDNTTNQSVNGIKTFLKSPVVPTPTLGTQAVNKSYIDTEMQSFVIAEDGRVIAEEERVEAEIQREIYIDDIRTEFNFYKDLVTVFQIDNDMNLLASVPDVVEDEFSLNNNGELILTY